MIPCAPKCSKRQQHRYLKTFGSQVGNKGSLKVKEAILRFLVQNIKRQQSQSRKGAR